MTFFGLIMILSVRAQEPRVDTVAIMIIDRMASVIGELTSCSFTLHTSIDIQDPEFGMIKQLGKDDVFLAGPDKMLVHFYGDKGHRGFWYNGIQTTYYSFDENNYVIIDAPDNIIAMIDTINKTYGIEFPAADFFYPTFTDDVIEFSENVIFLGKKDIDGQECFHILASNKDISAQFWFANDAYNLPVKYIITYKNENNKQFEATFSNWQLNHDIPLTIFEFMPPPKARQISILPRK